MLSKKMAFSLTSLITILALAFMVPAAMAQFEIKLNIGDADVSFADGNQVVYGSATVIKIMSTKVVNSEGGTAVTASGPILQASDFTVTAYNKFGGTVSTGAPTLGAISVDGTADGKHFMVSLGSVTAPTGDSLTDGTGITRVILDLKKDLVELADPRAEIGGDGTRKAAGKNKAVSIELHYVVAAQGTASDVDGTDGRAVPEAGVPIVYSIKRTGELLRPVTAATFEVLITLSEEPRKDGFKKDHIDVSKATAGDPMLLDKIDQTATDATPPMLSSGRDMMLYRYIVVITPKYENKDDIVIKVKSFYDQEKGTPMMYMPPATVNAYIEGTDMLTVKVGKEDLKAKVAGLKVGLPKEKHIPAGGYLVVADNKDGSSIHWSEADIKDAPKAHQRTPAELKYNTIALSIPNLETHFANGGTIGIMGPHTLMVTEIMWGSDASLDDPGKSQWLELYNAGAGYQTQDGGNTTYLVFYGPGEAPATGLHDLVGTVDDTAGYWSIAGKGQSGRTAEKVAGEAVAETVTSPIISMNRVMTAGVLAKGTLASSWVQSVPPSSNFEANRLGVHIGSPGAMPVTYPAPPEPAPEPVVTPPTPVADAMDIMITEIMVDTGNGRLPQWIELNNVSGAAVSLAGWSVEIENDPADAAAIGSDIEIQLSGTLGVSAHEGNMGQGNSLLLVSRTARSSSNLDGNKNIVDVSGTVGARGHYKLISDIAFMITLVPPQKTGVFTPGDMAGNLGASPAWEIPMNEDGRSSLIRHEMDAAGMATMGTDANGWVLASRTDLVSGPATWYGSDEDAGTPGYDAGGPLPVELSHFRPARDKATGAVVITWATQSELNNAGFFIKRSQQRDGEFKVINATMIAGAGTTSEKQTYTYTDTTAQPNIVYYYQIEDVSLDGNRQTLTRGIRLKGHIGAAGKLTSTWGEIKASNE